MVAGALVRSGIAGAGVAVSAGVAVCGGALVSILAAAVANVVGFVDGKSDCIALKSGVGTIGSGTLVGKPDGLAEGVGLAAVFAGGLVKSTAR